MKSTKGKARSHIIRHYRNYKEELIATALVLVVASGGSFFILSQVRPVEKTAVDGERQEQVLGEQTQEEEGGIDEVAMSPTPTPTSTPTPTPKPTPEPVIVEASSTPITNQVAEYLVADDRAIETGAYILELKNIKMVAKGSRTKSLKLEAVLKNKSASEGLKNQLTVSIVKDGNEIAPSAIMSVSESKTVMPEEQLTFTASISLIDGTDVKAIKYNPGVDGVEEIEYGILQ